jgi:hypothetical protein
MTILPLYLSMFITFCSCQSFFTIPLILEQVWGDHFSKIYFSSCNKDCNRFVVIPFYALSHDIQLTILTILHPGNYYPCNPCPENFKLWMAVTAGASIYFGGQFVGLGPEWISFSMHFVFFCLSTYYQPCDPFKNTRGTLPQFSPESSIWTFGSYSDWCYHWSGNECLFRNYFPSTDLYMQKTYDVSNHRLIVEIST